MNNKKKKRELTNEEIDENIFEMCNICSTTDCTGLIQVVPRTAAELESYEELYPFRPPFLPRDDLSRHPLSPVTRSYGLL